MSGWSSSINSNNLILSHHVFMLQKKNREFNLTFCKISKKNVLFQHSLKKMVHFFVLGDSTPVLYVCCNLNSFAYIIEFLRTGVRNDSFISQWTKDETFSKKVKTSRPKLILKKLYWNLCYRSSIFFISSFRPVCGYFLVISPIYDRHYRSRFIILHICFYAP